jgi:hypothetical protein
MQQKPTENGTEDNLLFHASLALDKPVMVLTRASIRLSKLNFESNEQKFRDYDGLALSIGVGEWPLIQQATLSIWKRRND